MDIPQNSSPRIDLSIYESALHAARTNLLYAYDLACSQGKGKEPWAEALAYSYHYACVAIERLDPDNADASQDP